MTLVVLAYHLSHPLPCYTWKIGGVLIPIQNEYIYLGFQINCLFKSSDRISNACRQGRNTFFALKELHCKSANPKVMVQLYNSVVLPSVLFGCETWTDLKTADIVYCHNIKKTIKCRSVVGFQYVFHPKFW